MTPAVTPQADTGLLSPQEFAGRIRAKYPGAYDSLSDDELTQRTLKKYPQYGGQVNLASSSPGNLKPPTMHRSFLVGDPDKDPDSRAVQMEPLTNLVKGFASASAPVIAHRVLQKTAPSLVPRGDMYEGETSLKDLPEAMGKTFAGAMVGPLAGEPLAGEVSPEQDAAPPPRLVDQVKAQSQPGMAMRVGKVLANRVPGVKLGGDLLDAVRGPDVPEPEPPPPPANWGQGKFGTPVDQWGSRIPEVARPARPAPAWQANPQPATEVPSILNRQPYAQAARPRLLDQVSEASAPPEEVPPSVNDVPQQEWDEGTSIDTRVENTPREDAGYDVNDVPADEWNLGSYMESGVEGTPRAEMMPGLLESLRIIEAAKAKGVRPQWTPE